MSGDVVPLELVFSVFAFKVNNPNHANFKQGIWQIFSVPVDATSLTVPVFSLSLLKAYDVFTLTDTEADKKWLA